ncbi:hypothetical protein M3Y94_00633100 [Aphelenchoides besseyi]|nr:hypothetical protein M3Y94_00633100 [Aphelenchoides besseyi]
MCKCLSKKKRKGSVTSRKNSPPKAQGQELQTPDVVKEALSQSRRLNDGVKKNGKELNKQAKLKEPEPSLPARDRSAEKMSAENTLKEVARQMPEREYEHNGVNHEPIFTNDQLL